MFYTTEYIFLCQWKNRTPNLHTRETEGVGFNDKLSTILAFPVLFTQMQLCPHCQEVHMIIYLTDLAITFLHTTTPHNWGTVEYKCLYLGFYFTHLSHCFIADSGDGPHNSAEDEEDDQKYSHLWTL